MSKGSGAGNCLNGAARRISSTYDSSGRASLITSHDNAPVGSGAVVNEVKQEYDG